MNPLSCGIESVGVSSRPVFGINLLRSVGKTLVPSYLFIIFFFDLFVGKDCVLDYCVYFTGKDVPISRSLISSKDMGRGGKSVRLIS